MGAHPQGIFCLGKDAEQVLELVGGKGLCVGHDLTDVFCRKVHDLLQVLDVFG
jgi:hypothetical protein